MKTVVIHGKGDLRTDETPLPAPGTGEIRVRPIYVGVCGSDIHYCFDGANGDIEVKEPLVPGHEVTAIVDLDPEGLLQPGTPVALHPARFGAPDARLSDREHLWAGGSYLGSASTMPHTHGGMREAMLVERRQIRELPTGLSLEQAALSEPLSVGLHALNRAGDLSGADVLIYGAGPIGLLAACAAVVRGANVTVADLLDSALERARTMGIPRVVNTGTSSIEPNSFDVVLECTGVQVCVNASMQVVRPGGTVVQVGNLPNRALELNMSAMTGKEISYLGTLRFRDEIEEAVSLLEAHPEFQKVVTHVFELSDVRQAFDIARDPAVSSKVLVHIQDELAPAPVS